MKRYTGKLTVAATTLVLALVSSMCAAAQQSYSDTVILKANEIRNNMTAASNKIQDIMAQAEKRKAELLKLKADTERQAAAMSRNDPRRAIVLKRYDDALAKFYADRANQDTQVRKYKDQIQAALTFLNDPKYRRFADVAEARKALERAQATVGQHDAWKSTFKGPGTIDTVAIGPPSGTSTFGIQPNPHNPALGGRPVQQTKPAGVPPVGRNGPALGVRYTRMPSGGLNVPSTVTVGAVFINNTDERMKIQVELVSSDNSKVSVANSKREPIWLGPRQTSGEYTWQVTVKTGGELPVHMNRYILETSKP